MYSLKEYHEPDSPQLIDSLPWALLEAPGVVRLKSGALMRCLEYRGHDPSSLTDFERIVIAAQTSAALMGLSQGWTLFSEIRRSRALAYPYTQGLPDAAQLVEDVRRERFGERGHLFSTRYVLTLVWSPKHQKTLKFVDRLKEAVGGLFEGGQQAKEEQALAQRRLEERTFFERATRDLASRLRLMCASVYFMDDAEVLEWLHGAISTHEHPMTPPDTPMYLDALLADEPVQCGLEMMIGASHVRTISIKGYPKHSHPRLLEALETFPLPMRLCSRFICLTREESIKAISSYQQMLDSQKEKANPFIEKGSDKAIDSHIVEQALETKQGLDAAIRGDVTFGYHSLVCVVRDEDYERCQRMAEEVCNLFRLLGFACREETANLKQSWLSTLPGHIWANARRSIISSQNMSHLLCTEAPWQGSPTNTHFGGPAHVTCRTDGQVPFYLNLNVNDVGHTMVLGPTGGGKSTLLCTLQMQFMKYRGAQVFVFDKGRSARASTLAMGGTFLELDMESKGIAFQPLGRVDEPAEFEFALNWLQEVATLGGVRMTHTEHKALTQALHSLKSMAPELRTMTALTIALQHMELREVFEPYAQGRQGEGVYAKFWDHSREHLGLTRYTTIEMESLMNASPTLVAITLRYLFHRIGERLTIGGPPSLLVLDEAWLFLSHPMFANTLKEWLKVLRKKNTYVVFATQEITDALESDIAPTLLQNCPTSILLANPKAMQESIYASYRKLGLSRGQIQAISRLQSGGDRAYYIHNSLGSRAFHLGLSELELAFADNSGEAHARMNMALRLAAQKEEPYLAHYLELCGFHTHAERLKQAARLSRYQQGRTLS